MSKHKKYMDDTPNVSINVSPIMDKMGYEYDFILMAWFKKGFNPDPDTRINILFSNPSLQKSPGVCISDENLASFLLHQ